MKNVLKCIVFAVVLLAVAAATVSAAPADDRSGLLKIQTIDKSNYPKITLHLGLTTTKEAVAFKIFQDGRPVKKLVVHSDVDKKPVAVTLLMDVSGSMKGKPLDDAKAAAKLFIERAQPQDRISLVAFSSNVSRVADFTADKEQLYKAIDGLQAGGETAVYDALIDSLNNIKTQTIADKRVILLSDGADTASRNSEASVSGLAEASKIPVSVVALHSAAFNLGPLEAIARRSGGPVLTALSSEALSGLYDDLAAELHSRYALSFDGRSKTANAKLKVEATVDGQRLQATTTMIGLPQPRDISGTAKKSVDRVNNLSWAAHPLFAGGLAFLAVFLLALGLGNIFLPSQNTLADQLKYYDQLRGRETSDPEQPFTDHIHESLVGIVKTLSAKFDFTTYAQQKLEQAGLPVKPHEYILMHLAGVIGLSLLALLLTGSALWAFLIIALGATGPLAVIEIMVERRRAKFNEQLPDTLDMLASSMRAGYGLQQAVVAAGREARQPTAGEFTRLSGQVQMGMTLEDALEKMADRLDNASFRWVVLAITIHRETGGNLAEILDNLSRSLRQRETMRRQISALTAEGRLSAVILIVLPFAEGLLLAVVNPTYMSTLVTTIPGVLMLLVSLMLMATGGIWLRNITNIDY